MKSTRPVVLLVESAGEAAARAGVPAALESAQEFQLSRLSMSGDGLGALGLAAAVLWRRALVVHVQGSADIGEAPRDLARIRAARMCGASVVYELRCAIGPGMPAGGQGAARLRRLLRLPDAVIVPGKRELDACRKIAPDQHFLDLPKAVDHGLYAGVARDPLAPEAPLRLLYVGRLAREDGIYEALQGLRLALVHDVPAHLTIAGGGPDEAALRRFAHGLGLDDFVSFVGPVGGEAAGHETKLVLFRNADAFLLPTQTEALPRALLEAMAAGLPAIVTRAGAISEVVTDGVHGLFVKPRDAHTIARAIATLSLERESLPHLGEACRNRIAAGYSTERLLQETRGLYSELIAARGMKTVTRV